MLDKCHFVMKTPLCQNTGCRGTLHITQAHFVSWAGWVLGNGTVAGPGPARRYFIWEGGAGADAGATVVLPAPTRQMPNNHVFKWPLAQAEVFFYW